MLDLQWSHAFKIQSDSEVLPLLTCCKQFFRERVCAHAQMSVLLRALRRPGYQGLSWDVDFHACGQSFSAGSSSQYNKGVLRSILCQGVLTQHALCARQQVADGTCPFCGRAPETLFHLYWECAAWNSTRSAFEVPEVETVRAWEPCTQQCGIFLLPPTVKAFAAELRAELFPLPEVSFPKTCHAILNVWVDGSAVDCHDPRVTRTGAGIYFACDSLFTICPFQCLAPCKLLIVLSLQHSLLCWCLRSGPCACILTAKTWLIISTTLCAMASLTVLALTFGFSFSLFCAPGHLVSFRLLKLRATHPTVTSLKVWSCLPTR